MIVNCESVSCSLHVICRGSTQKQELEKRFGNESPGNGRFYIWNRYDEHPNRIDFAFSTCDLATSRDNDILELAEWLQSNFKLNIKGYWKLQDADSASRGEVHDGEIKYADLMWIGRYTVEQIIKIHKMAEERFGTGNEE